MMEETTEARMGRYLSGEAGRDEKEAFEKEMESNPAFKEDFRVFQSIWDNSPAELQTTWNSDSAWQTFVHRTQPAVNEGTTIRRINVKWAVAAAIILALGSFFLFWNTGKPIAYAFNDKSADPLVLSDGSKIYLNKGASVNVYPFKHKKRRVKLDGEAFFEVSPDPERPFTVESGGTITEVVGTAFDITETSAHTRIFVQHGKVIFKSADKEKTAVALTAGEAAVFEENRMQMIPNPSPNINAWHTGHLSFPKNMSVADIIADASSYFNTPINLENTSLSDCRISSTLIYNAPEIFAVLKPLASFVNGTIKVEGNQYTIVGGTCP
jgi:transmembrane sensor